jgi:hypothetical protein
MPCSSECARVGLSNFHPLGKRRRFISGILCQAARSRADASRPYESRRPQISMATTSVDIVRNFLRENAHGYWKAISKKAAESFGAFVLEGFVRDGQTWRRPTLACLKLEVVPQGQLCRWHDWGPREDHWRGSV